MKVFGKSRYPFNGSLVNRCNHDFIGFDYFWGFNVHENQKKSPRSATKFVKDLSHSFFKRHKQHHTINKLVKHFKCSGSENSDLYSYRSSVSTIAGSFKFTSTFLFTTATFDSNKSIDSTTYDADPTVLSLFEQCL